MPEMEIPEATATPTKAAKAPKQKPAEDKRAEALRAKKKKKRAAHRVALRRSHASG
jgi:hypothetical protein